MVIGILLVFILGYYLAISETLALKKNYDNLNASAAQFSNIPERLASLKYKEKMSDSLLTHYQITHTSLQNNLLKTIDRYASEHNLSKVSFSEPHQYTQQDRLVNSYAFSVEGDFASINGLAYQLEQRSKFGMISSLHFEKIKNYRNGKISLQGHFILQLVQ